MLNKDNLCIKAILEAISKINKYTQNHTNHDEFYLDSISFEASMMNFVVIGEMVAKISEGITLKLGGNAKLDLLDLGTIEFYLFSNKNNSIKKTCTH